MAVMYDTIYSDLFEAVSAADFERLEKIVFQSDLSDSDSETDSETSDGLLSEIDWDHRSSYQDPTLLHIAVGNEDENIISFLLERTDCDVNLCANYHDSLAEMSPLLLAIEINNQAIVKRLIAHPDIDLDTCGSDPDTPSPLAFAIYLNNFDAVEALVNHGAEKFDPFSHVLASDDHHFYRSLYGHSPYTEASMIDLLELGAIDMEAEDIKGRNLAMRAIADRHDDLFMAAVIAGAQIDDSVYDLLDEDDDADRVILNFLNYRPGQDQESIFEAAERGASSEVLNRMALDCVDTTDASSSESSSEEDTVVANVVPKPTFKLPKGYHKRRDAAINRYNKSLKKTGDVEQSEHDALRILSYRGMHFAPSFFNQATREAVLEDTAVGKPAVSHATSVLAGYDADDEVDETSNVFKEADKEIKRKFKKMKLSKDKPETANENSTRNKKQFETLYYRFVQAYVENYDQLFSKGGIKKDFGFDAKHNPGVSSAYRCDRAMHYAAGDRVKQDPKQNRRNPHFRRTTGRLKHRNLGFTDVYAMDIPYVKSEGAHVLDLIQRGKIGIGHVKQFECEILFESHIPGKYHILREPFKLPSFKSNYSDKIMRKYGLSYQEYMKYKNSFQYMTDENGSSSAYDLLNKLVKLIIAHHSQALEAKARELLANGEAELYDAFPSKQNRLEPEPVSPNNKAVWSPQPKPQVARTPELQDDGVDAVTNQINSLKLS